MFIPAIIQFFKYKVVSSIIVFTCNWMPIDQIKLTRQFTQNGMSVTFSCDPSVLSDIDSHHFQGVLYVSLKDDSLLDKVESIHFSLWYKWLIIGDEIPFLHQVRYDADIALLTMEQHDEDSKETKLGPESLLTSTSSRSPQTVSFNDIYVHPRDGASVHPWALWTVSSDFQPIHERERILRRHDLKMYSLKIASPLGLYSRDWYNGSFQQYLLDDTMPERDSGTRCGYGVSSLIIQSVNSTAVLMETLMWSAMDQNSSSMLKVVASGTAQLTGSHLRILNNRIEIMDYIIPIWPFSLGFTYLAERKSSSNMYVEPFSAQVWWCFLGVGVIVALALRVTARRPEEKDGAYIGVLASYLQQDASAVPEGISGRWSFIVLSVSSMLVHAYYTSAIVSALMSSGTNGPETLRALGDSRYAIASENYEYMRSLFFDVKTNWDDLEYLKKKKKTSKLYHDIDRGVELIRGGNTAYHTEYNQLYPHLKTFSDEQLCKIQHVDIISETRTWITTSKRSEWTDLFRSKGGWLRETGLITRLSSRLTNRPPICRSSLLAERVNFGDVAPLLVLTVFGAVLAFLVLGLEMGVAKLKRKRSGDNEPWMPDVSESL